MKTPKTPTPVVEATPVVTETVAQAEAAPAETRQRFTGEQVKQAQRQQRREARLKEKGY